MIGSNIINSNISSNYDKSDACNDCFMTDSNSIQRLCLNESFNNKVSNTIKNPIVIPRLRSNVKENKFQDMKKHTLEKLIERMQKDREDRMEKIFLGKRAILDNLKNEIYDDIKYYNDDDFNEYVKDYFSNDNLSFYFDQIAYCFETNNEISNITEYEANIYQNDHVISFCPYCSELVFKTKSNIICSRSCFNYYIGDYDPAKINLGQMMTSLKNIIKEHESCKRSFELIECNERVIFFCTRCLF